MSIGPDIASLLHGGGAPPFQPGAPAQDSPNERVPIQILKQMIALSQQYIHAEPDAQDKATMAQIAAKLHSYLAKDQADTQQVLGSPAAARVIGRAFGGGQ